MSTDQNSGSPLGSGSIVSTGVGSGADGSYFATPSFELPIEMDLSAIQSGGLDAFDHGDPPSDAIEFRVVRSGLPVRRLRLTGNRYTFGSAEGCSIRLNDPTLRPMHAVLIREPSRVMVRAYSVPVNVNGKQKTESTLNVGDVMRLGVYQFELMSVAKQTPSPTDASHRLSPVDAPEIPLSTAPRSVFDAPPAVNRRSTNRRSTDNSSPDNSSPVNSSTNNSSTNNSSTDPDSTDTRSTKPRAGQTASLPSAEDVIWRERLRREIDQWRERQIECDHREQRIDQREASLRGRETELWTRAETLLRRESRLQSQESTMLQLQEDYSQRQQDLIELREQTLTQKDALRAREAEFRRQESEYQFKLEEASRQLTQSRQQAESATQAVQRMREQFESLNRQIDDLSSQQKSLQSLDSRRQDESEAVRERLEQQRDAAVQSQTQSEALRREAESRLEAMASELESLKNATDEDLVATQAELAASENLVADLQSKVAELQRTVDQASEESARLRRDYAEACESVRQLESLVAQSNQRGDLDRESWAAEADQLRMAIDELSIDLARANSEVSELSGANEALSARLQQVQAERDEAQSRPSHQAFESLQRELEAANEKLAEMKRDYEQTIDQRDKPKSQSKPTPDANTPSSPVGPALPVLSDFPSLSMLPVPVVSVPVNPVPVNPVPVNPGLQDSSVADSDADDVAALDDVADASNRDVIRWGLLGDSVDQPAPAQDAASDADGNRQWNNPDDIEDADASCEIDSGSVAINQVDSVQVDSVQIDSVQLDSVQLDSVQLDSDGYESDDNDDDVWPMYQTVAPEPVEDSAEPDFVEPVRDESDEVDPWQSSAVWQKADEAESQTGDEFPVAEDQIGNQSDAVDAVDDVSPFQGSLASMLIKDFETQADSELPDSESLEPESLEQESLESESVELESIEPELLEPESFEPATFKRDSFESESAEPESPEPESAEPESAEPESLEPESLGAELADFSDTYDGTFVLEKDDPNGSPWKPAGGAAHWDREYSEESGVDDASGQNESEHFESDHLDGIDRRDPLGVGEMESRSDDDDVSESPSMIAASDAATTTSTEPAAADEDDDSIEAYMNRLLNRVQGSSSGSNTSATKPETLSMSTSLPTQKTSSVSDSLSMSIDSSPAAEPMDPNAPLVPRSQAPERKSDLSAMRDLANSSARTAISHSTKIQIRNIQLSGMCSLGLAVGSIVVAMGSTFLFGLTGGLLYLAWAMTLIIAGISVRDAMNSFAEARRRMKVRSEPNIDDADV